MVTNSDLRKSIDKLLSIPEIVQKKDKKGKKGKKAFEVDNVFLGIDWC